MSLPLFIVDAFADAPFAGNPAAVALSDDEPAAEFMQSVAAEMNLSETAFVGPESSDGARPLRWFTPAAEVDLCGHATLAAAHVLSAERGEAGPFRFATRSGVLPVTVHAGRVELDFPAEPAVASEPWPELAAALGVEPAWVGRNRFDLLCELPGAAAVRACSPDLLQLVKFDARGVIVTAAADAATPGPDFVSRFFAPAVGVPEDPVTGSAHCALGPYWAAKLGRDELVGRQIGPRGGSVAVTVRPNDRVRLAGGAVTVLRGELAV